MQKLSSKLLLVVVSSLLTFLTIGSIDSTWDSTAPIDSLQTKIDSVKSQKDTIVDYGIASWYGPGFHGRKTASGEIFNTYDFTAAHRNLPFGTIVRVTNLSNDKWVEVKINDRGPFIKGRIIDLSKASKEAIGMDGLANVKIEYVQKDPDTTTKIVKKKKKRYKKRK